MNFCQTLVAVSMTVIFVTSSDGQQPTPKPTNQLEIPKMSHEVLFKKLLGSWEGTSQTWGTPGKLMDQSKVRGNITAVFGGRFVRHQYEGTINGKPRAGEEMIAFNSVTQTFEISWVDDFHMSDTIMFSKGKATDRGFAVTGQYDVGPEQPKWGWRTEFDLLDDNHLTVTAYNIHPEGMEAKAVQTVYHRVPEHQNHKP